MPILHRTPQIISAAAPWYLVLDGLSTIIDCGNGASINDLCLTPPFTVESWIQIATSWNPPHVYAHIAFKLTEDILAGWYLAYKNSDLVVPSIVMTLFSSNGENFTEARSNLTESSNLQWLHCVGYIHDDLNTRAAVNGIWGNGRPNGGWDTEMIGKPVSSDAGTKLFVGGDGAIYEQRVQGLMGWTRISNIDRYNAASGSSFVPPYRSVIPDIDANTILLYGMNEQEGTTINDLSGNGNHGLLTGTYAWGKGY